MRSLITIGREGCFFRGIMNFHCTIGAVRIISEINIFKKHSLMDYLHHGLLPGQKGGDKRGNRRGMKTFEKNIV